jgi:GxxExxY protein
MLAAMMDQSRVVKVIVSFPGKDLVRATTGAHCGTAETTGHLPEFTEKSGMNNTALGRNLLYGDLSYEVLGAFFEVNRAHGHGFLEAVYRRSMHTALTERGVPCESEVKFEVKFHGVVVGDYRADLVVDRKIIVECKAVEQVTAIHEAQLINYLKASGLQLGMLLNFGPKSSYKRLICSSFQK